MKRKLIYLTQCTNIKQEAHGSQHSPEKWFLAKQMLWGIYEYTLDKKKYLYLHFKEQHTSDN